MVAGMHGSIAEPGVDRCNRSSPHKRSLFRPWPVISSTLPHSLMHALRFRRGFAQSCPRWTPVKIWLFVRALPNTNYLLHRILHAHVAIRTRPSRHFPSADRRFLAFSASAVMRRGNRGITPLEQNGERTTYPALFSQRRSERRERMVNFC